MEWEKSLWTHSINLNAIFLDRIFLCWNVRALLHESTVITSQRQLLNLSVRMHSNCPCRPYTIQTSEKCSLFSFDARTKIEFFHTSLSHRHWRRRSLSPIFVIQNRNAKRARRQKKLIVNEIRTQSRRRIEETEERLHFSERRTHTHIYKIHYTERDSPMKIAHRRFIFISSGDKEHHRRHCHRMLPAPYRSRQYLLLRIVEAVPQSN